MTKYLNQQFLFIIVLTLMISCHNRKIIDWDNQILQFKESVKDEPFEFLTDYEDYSMSVLLINYPDGVHLDGLCGIIFQQKLEKDEFELVSKKLDDNSILKSDFLNSDDYYTPDLKIKMTNSQFPVPNFDDSWFSIREKVSLGDSRIFGLKHKDGNFFSKSFLNKISNDSDYTKIIDKIGNGYSNGAVLDCQSRTVYYWIIIW